MKRIRYWWWLLAAFISKHKKTIFIASILSVAASLSAPKLWPKLVKRWSVTTIGVIGNFRQTDLPEFISRKISDGLVRIDDKGQPAPDLASEWSISDDGKVYLFTLDAQKKWHDGTRLTTSDIHLAIDNVQTEVVDEKTIKFILKEPFSPFPTVLSRPIYKSGLIGTGPYQQIRIKKNGDFVDRLVLTKIEDQTGNSFGPETIMYKFYRTTKEVITALKLGEIDEIAELTSVKDISDINNLNIITNMNFDRYTAVFFNNKDSRLAEKSFRQALTYAIPNKPTDHTRTLSPINPNSWGYNPQVKPYNTDVDSTKELLKSVFGDEAYPTLELTTFLPYLTRAEEIAKAWTEIGIKTDVKVATSPPDDFQTLLIGQQIPPDPDQYILWHSTQLTNITHYSSPKVDKLLEDGRKETDQIKRREIYRDFQRFLLEDSPAAFLEHITTYTVKRK